jgi:hypothetical protein
MNCFNHRDRPAIGLCKSCGKGVCADCLSEIPNGLACKGSCEDRVNLINRIIDSNTQIVMAARHGLRTRGLLMLLMGMGCFVFSVWAFFESEGSFLPYFLGLLAIVCLLTGVFALSRKEQYPQLEQKRT